MVANRRADRVISNCASKSGRARNVWQVLTLLSLMLIMIPANSPAAQAADVPVVKGDLGPCTADFTVTDSSKKPLYDAKIQVTIVYGFMNKRKSDLQVGTNADGKGRFEGLPAKVKKPLKFVVRHGSQPTQSVMHNPEINCQASFTVAMSSQ